MKEERLSLNSILNIDNFFKSTFYKENISKKYHGKEPYFLCIIAGCSGSGKSYFEKILSKEYPDYFNKLPQITTRKCRGNDDTGYYFVNEDIYEYFKSKLFAKLSSFNGNQYGTIPVFQRNKINTVIASYDAIEDIFSQIENVDSLFIVPMFLLFDIDSSNITESGKRTDRDEKFLQKEKIELYNVFEKYKEKCLFYKSYKYEDFGRYATFYDFFKF